MNMILSPTDKSTLRAQCLALRDSFDDSYKRLSGKVIFERLAGMVGEGKIIAAYLPIRGEVDILSFIPMAYKNSFCLPVVVGKGKSLIFRAYRSDMMLEKGDYGVDVPSAREPEMVPDIVLVPLVAFDAVGHRLGYGAGYYDRTIKQLRESKKGVQIIGVAYGRQQVEHIPSEPHDEKLDRVVTEL